MEKGDWMDQIKTKRRTIGGKTIISMLILSAVLILGTCAAALYQMANRTIEIYSEFAYSYAQLAAVTIHGEDIERYLMTGRKDARYQAMEFFLEAAAYGAGIKYFYVVVPTEEDLIYIWDTCGSDYKGNAVIDSGEQPASLLDHEPYSGDEKKYMMQVMQGEGVGPLILDSNYDEHEVLGTALWPVMDVDGNVKAVVGADISIAGVVESAMHMFWNIFAAVGIVMGVCMLVYYRSTRKGLIQPIIRLGKAAEDLIVNLDKNSEFHIDIHTGDEIEDLAHSFEGMGQSLKKYLKELESVTAEKERINTELDLARRIQADLLPSDFPAFPDREEFDIYASMQPAKEVGGDYYDFFLTDETHLCLVIADVSGKGVPAALFMAMTRILVRNYIDLNDSVKEVMELVNDQICESNKEGMFVTIWLGMLDLETGVLTTANAGHEYPILKRPDGNFEICRKKHGFVVGGMEGMAYQEFRQTLEPGSKLFIYTDGVPEANNRSQEMFGLDRTLEVLNAHGHEDPRSILEAVGKSVESFEEGTDPFDDKTMLCLTYNGPSGKRHGKDSGDGQEEPPES